MMTEVYDLNPVAGCSYAAATKDESAVPVVHAKPEELGLRRTQSSNFKGGLHFEPHNPCPTPTKTMLNIAFAIMGVMYILLGRHACRTKLPPETFET